MPSDTDMFLLPCSQIEQLFLLLSASRYWNQITFTGKRLAFGDGGSVDNLAVTPLLRRRITKIIATVAASQNISSSANASDWAGYQYDLAGLFGACPPTHPAYDKDGTIIGTPVDLFNRKLQVWWDMQHIAAPQQSWLPSNSPNACSCSDVDHY